MLENVSPARAEIERWYASAYDFVYHSGITAFIYGLVFRFMERPHKGGNPAKIVEMGAGNGDYRAAANPSFTEYVEVDLRDWSEASTPEKVTRLRADAEQTDLPSNYFDRLVATCVLVHLANPERALFEWKRIVRPGGSLTIYVPPEAGLLVRLLRALYFWPKARRKGFDARVIASLEHRYSYFYLDALLRDVFSEHEIRRRTVPFKIFEYDLALFHVYEIRLRD